MADPKFHSSFMFQLIKLFICQHHAHLLKGTAPESRFSTGTANVCTIEADTHKARLPAAGNLSIVSLTFRCAILFSDATRPYLFQLEIPCLSHRLAFLFETLFIGGIGS